MKAKPLLSIAIVITLLLAGVTFVLLDQRAEATVLTKFGSELELRNFLGSHAPQGTSQKGLAAYDEASGSTAAPSYSATNTQVQGVDEGDLVKTDGDLVLIAQGSTVHILTTRPSLANLTAIDLGYDSAGNGPYIQALYLWDHQLIVVFTVNEQTAVGPGSPAVAMPLLYYPYYATQRSCVAVYDLQDPAHPAQVRTAGVSGSPITTRMIGGTVYVVAEQSVWYGDKVVMPVVSDNGRNESVAATAVGYDPSCPEVSCFVNLLAYDVSAGEEQVLSTLAGPTSVVYMSPTSLYLTMQHSSGIMPMSSSEQTVTTTIYRIAVNRTAMSVAAHGEVDGWPLDQFALDERDGRLRVATTTSWSDPSNNVYVMDLSLNRLGALTQIAPGERIFSSRYLDDRLYLVTFRQVDPLFVIDLSTDVPRTLGALKVPGASTYLQMVDAGLVGIGFDNGSVKVSLYNVSDPARMFEVGSYVVDGYSYSEAQYEHKAVMYDPTHHVLVIPVMVYGGSDVQGTSANYYRPWSAALVLSLDVQGVRMAGQVVHENASVERALYIGDVLYTVSDTTVKANALPSLAPLGSLTYSDGQSYYGGYGVSGGGAAVPAMVK